MAGENIFVLQLSTPNPTAVIPNTGIAWDSGYRSVLAVRMIWAKVQTTVLFGDSLYLIGYNIGSLDPPTLWKTFLSNYFNRPMPAAQLPYPPFAATPALYYRYNVQVPPPPIPTSTGTVTILDAGFDPFRGYWIEFAGNYFLTFPLFKNWANVIRDGPDYKGFQPSANNPGGSGPGGSTPPPNIPPTTC